MLFRSVVPVENSIEGSVSVTMDKFVKTNDIFIQKEIILSISHSLLSKDNVALQDVTDVISHSQPLGQCQQFIHEKLPEAKSHVTSSTAEAAKIIQSDRSFFADGKPHVCVAIGNKRLADMYNLQVIKENINDYEGNQTRFYVLGKTQADPSGHDKTAIVFSASKDKPGSLCKNLLYFEEEKINLTHISSRPTKKILGEYLFFLDFEGHIHSPHIQRVIEHIKSNATFFRLLGSFRRDKL